MRYQPRESRQDHPNLVPLIDVMLCLIVFFMLAAKIGVVTGADQAISVPMSRIGQRLDLGQTLVLNIRQDPAGNPLVSALVDDVGGEVVVLRTDDADENGLTQLDRELRRLQKRHPDMQIALRTDEGVEYKAFIRVLVAVNRARIRNIFHNVKEPEAVASVE